jgi:hypothetical protein
LTYLPIIHPPVLSTLIAHALNQEKLPCLSYRHKNWDVFRHLINKRLTLKVSLKTEEYIEVAVKFLNNAIQLTGYRQTQNIDCPIFKKAIP